MTTLGTSLRRHSPTLDTILMVEKTIKKTNVPQTKTQLWNALPKKVMYQTYKEILGYLDASGKIMFDEKNRIVWVAADTPKLKAFFDRSVKLA
ncbi:MAG: hypothetical protein ACRECH_15340 [Nitrososphaerales archaeon]